MYSQQEVVNNQNAFIVHKPTKPSKKLPKLYNSFQLSEKCWSMYYEILKNTQKQIAQRIIDIINEFESDLKMKQQIQIQKNENNKKQQKVKNQPKKKTIKKSQNKNKNENENDSQSEGQKVKKKPTKLFIPLCIRKSQQQYIEGFTKQIQRRLSQFNSQEQKQKHQQIDLQQHISDQQEIQKQKGPKKFQYKAIKSARKINIFQKQDTKDVAKIALYIHQKLKVIHINKDISIYLTKTVVQLSEENIYILQQGLAQTSCIVIVPTTHSFQQSLIRRFSKNQIIPIKLFNHKDLFYELMYKCITDPIIKAYFPKESLKLLDDFEDFPISFKQGTYRLIHCLQRLQILRKRGNIQFKYVEINKLFKAIELALSRNFRFFKDKYWNLKKFIKCILDESEPFNIFDKYTSKNNYFGRQQQGCKTQVQIMVEMRKKLIKYIQKDETIKQYSSYFKQNKSNSLVKPKTKRDKQMQRYKVDSKNNLDQKGMLQHQIKTVIHHLTSQIRKQANFFKWEQFHYVDQIKPMLPYNIIQSVRQLSPIHEQILEYIYQSISIPLIKVVNEFCVAYKKLKYGELMYYMKDLELFGLIDVSESSLNPVISPSFFDKATYANRKIN